MYGISGEHLLVLLVILLIFGPRRLPDLGHSIGRTMKNFRDGLSGANNPTSASAPASTTPVASQLEARRQEAASPAPTTMESPVVEQAAVEAIEKA